MTRQAREPNDDGSARRVRLVGECLDGTLASLTAVEARLRRSIRLPAYDISDARLMEAMRHPARIRMEFWYNALQEHRHHPTFDLQTWPYTLEYGFTCACSGEENEWRIRVSDLHGQVPEAREVFSRLLRQRFGGKKARRAQRRADIKARALLHQYLTKEQRWDLRATKSFMVKGADGRTYRVTEGSAGNVQLLQGDTPKYTLCVVPVHKVATLPVYDLMLAQKVLIESEPELFLKTAIVRDLVTGVQHKSGAFLFNGAPPPAPSPPPAPAPTQPEHPAQITPYDVDHPREWVVARLTEAQHGDPDGHTERERIRILT